MTPDRAPYPPDPRYSVTRDGRVFRDVGWHRAPPRELRQYDSKRGYLRVQLQDGFANVHQMVALAFLPNPEGKPEVAHNNGRKHDNRVNNLRWATRQENCDDMAVHGTRVRGETHPTRILSEQEVAEIRAIVVGKTPRVRPYHREVAVVYGITRECITRIANGNRWQHAASR